MRTWNVWAVAAALLVSTAPAQDDAVKKEYARFRGTWKIVSMEVEGAKAPVEQFKDLRFKLDGERFSTVGGGDTNKGTFKVGVSKMPKQMDITFTDGLHKGDTLLAIYKLEGDTYTVCIAMPGRDRPKEFVSKPASGHVLEVLKREKP